MAWLRGESGSGLAEGRDAERDGEVVAFSDVEGVTDQRHGSVEPVDCRHLGHSVRPRLAAAG